MPVQSRDCITLQVYNNDVSLLRTQTTMNEKLQSQPVNRKDDFLIQTESACYSIDKHLRHSHMMLSTAVKQ